jgi:hypothetical protein
MTIQHLDQAEILERKANVVRSRLMRTIDALDRRRHRAVATTEHLERAAAPVAAMVFALLTVGSGVAYVAHRASVRRHRNAWRNLLARRLAPSRPARPSFFAEAARRAALALIMIAVQELGKRAVRHALEPAKKIDVRGERSLA